MLVLIHPADGDRHRATLTVPVCLVGGREGAWRLGQGTGAAQAGGKEAGRQAGVGWTLGKFQL